MSQCIGKPFSLPSVLHVRTFQLGYTEPDLGNRSLEFGSLETLNHSDPISKRRHTARISGADFEPEFAGPAQRSDGTSLVCPRSIRERDEYRVTEKEDSFMEME